MPATLPAAFWRFKTDETWPASRRYKPLTTLEIVNNDAVNLTILVNGNTTLYVPHTSQKSWDDLPVYEVSIQNTDALLTTVLGLITVSLFKPPMNNDDFMRERYA
jgi:hypothetical protein